MKQIILSAFSFLTLVFGTAMDAHATTPGLELIAPGAYGPSLNYCGYRLLPVQWNSNQLIVEVIRNPRTNRQCSDEGMVMTMSCSDYTCTLRARVQGGVEVRQFMMISSSSFKETTWIEYFNGSSSDPFELIFYRY